MEREAVEKWIRESGAAGYGADSLRAFAYSDDLQLFWVINTAGNKQYILATEAKLARVLACKSGHTHERRNGQVFRATDKFYEREPGFGSSVKRAIKDRTPGVIEKKGNHAAMGDKIYSPLHEVEK